MEATATSRMRVAITFVFTLLLLVGEFTFLMSVYHLDDGVERHREQQARVAGTLAAWRPGTPTTAVAAAVDAIDRDLTSASRLRDRTRTWAQTPGPGELAAVAAADRGLAQDLSGSKSTVDREAAGILAGLLVLVSIGWFAWFRQLVRRHRALQREVTERQTLDAGERRLLALVRGSADLVVVLEPDSTASFVSPSSTSVLGVPTEDLTGQRFVDLLRPHDVSMFVRLLAASREGEQAITLGLSHPDGRDRVLDGTLNNLTSDPAVSGWVLTLRDVTDQQALKDELSYQSFHDAMTGLANRQLFGERLAHALRRRGGAASLAVLFVDVDDFKQVNDRLGHQAGDLVLKSVADRISAAIREGDTAARTGGDEFAILMEDADEQTARDVAFRLLDSLGQAAAVGDDSHSVRASIGIAVAVPGEADPEQTARNAEVAMHWAKDRGKGTVAMYEAGLHAQALEKMAMRGELQQAIRGDEMVLHFQPTVDLKTRRISGFEALVRWQHPVRGLLGPVEFIPVAEQSGLIVPLGSWVLREACRAAVALRTERNDPSMAVNIAAQQLAQPTFVEEVTEVLEATGLPARALVLEITESVLLDDMEGTVAALTRLRELGIRVAIDDFGTGYSSLSYLTQLPVDILKIDKSFVDQVCGRNLDTSLVEAIITMSQGMRLVTVAEGVEEPEQADWLSRHRCTVGQGYLWSRPVPLVAAQALLIRGTDHVSLVHDVAS